ncbi:helix-turn-helix transcriptional regulator [Ornithinibacillus sp. JPR2-1]|uniref:helix-turn-helix domain-containing protein n=1 Tax=Ornithinibacillus sp. JPR2-1 TaxID=2094019 RepID=UPI0031DD72B5
MEGLADLSNKLRQMRRRAKLSQEALSEKLNMSRSNISKLESGKLEIRGKDFLRWVQETNSQDMLIAMACNIDIASAAQILVDFLPAAGTIILGWCF